MGQDQSAPSGPLKLSQICPGCKSIFEGQRIEKEVGPDPAPGVLDQSLQDVERAAQEGCHLCHLLLESLTKTERQNLEGCEKIAYGYWQHGLGDGIAFDFYYPVLGTASTEYLTKSILVQPEEETLGRSHNHKSWTSPSSDCQASYELARQWIFTCEGTHRNCNALRRIQTPRKLPTRLVDLGDDRNYRKPRLCITEGLPLDTAYITLSHCWGGQTPLQLRKDNFESFTEGMEISQVSKSFRDALKVVAKLKVRYLWIDSLCIIQDSTEDWQREASLMSDVYTNSWCNIAATKALDGRDGCFAERTLLDISQCVIEAEWDSHPSQTYVCWIPNIWDHAIDNQKLLQRAWVTQEMVLSPRVLHFSEHQMFWECLELRACETFPLGIPRNKGTKLSSHTYSLRHDLIKYEDPMRQRLALWGRYLHEYTRCFLTFPEKDKLAAVSGLARKLGPGDDYCAGLWRQDLAGQLMWSVAKAERPSKAVHKGARKKSSSTLVVMGKC